MRLALQKIYNTIPYQVGQSADSRAGAIGSTGLRQAPYWIMKPMRKAAEMMQKHIDGILAYWGSGKLTTAYLEGLNSVFSAVKEKARGFEYR